MRLTPLGPRSTTRAPTASSLAEQQVINDTSRSFKTITTLTPYGVMGSSPTWLRVIHEHGSGKAVRTCPFWPSVPELRVLITLEPETVERLPSSRPRSGASPSAMTHHNLDLSIRFPFIITLSPPFHLHHFVLISSTLNPGCVDTIVPPYLHPESNCSSPGQVFFRPLSIHYLFVPTQPT